MAGQILKSIRKAIRYWYIPLLAGLLLITLGVWVLRTPVGSYLTLSFIFSVSFILSGIAEIVFSVSNRKILDNWGWILLFGITNFIAGSLMIVNPLLSIVTLPLYLGSVTLFRAVCAISVSLDLKKYGVKDWVSLMMIGILGLVFSCILLWNPFFAGLTIVFWTAGALIASGIFSIYFALRLKKLHDLPDKKLSDPKEIYERIKTDIRLEVERNRR